jgi:hypothetical protein
MNPMVPLDRGDLFPSIIYGHLRGWSTSIDLDHDILDLGYDAVDLGYDAVDLGYDVLDKNKRVHGRRSKQISR